MRLTKRLLSMLLMVCMVLSMLPAIALTASAATTTDQLTATSLGLTTSYTTHNTSAFASGAVYSSLAYKGSQNGTSVIQVNNTSSRKCGIITTTSGGKAKSVTVDFYTAGKTVQVYGSNTAFTSSFYSTASGTLLGSGTNDFTVSNAQDFAYIGIRMGATGATYINSISIEWEDDSTPSYTLTAQSNNTNYGTVGTPSNGTVACTPATGYYVASASVTSGCGLSVAVSGNNVTYTGTQTANAVITVTFAAKTQATLTYSENGTTHNHSGTHYVGDSITLADANTATVNGKTFVGWYATNQGDFTGTPTLLGVGDSYTLSAASNTLYAVYATVSGGGSGSGDYVLVESAPTDWAGDYLIVYNNTNAMNTHYADTNTNTYATYTSISSYYNSSTKSIASNSTTNALKYTAAQTTNGYSLQGPGTDTTYLGTQSTGSTGAQLRWDTSFTANNDEWTLGVGSIVSVKTNTLAIRWNTGSPRFAIYGTSNQSAIQLFKKEASATYSDYTTTPVAAPADTYSITITPPAVGTISTNNTLTGLEENDTATLTANPPTGYEIDEWTITGAKNVSYSGSNATITIGTSDVTATVSFQKINYTITKNAGSNGSITAAASANYQDAVSFTVTPASGYQINTLTVTQTSGGAAVAFTGSGTSYEITSMPAANVTITATFSALPTYSYTIYNNGTSVGSGTAASVTAPAAPSPSSIQYTDPDTLTTSTFTFAGWGVQSTAITEPGAYTGTLYAAGETIPLSANDTVIRAIYVNGSSSYQLVTSAPSDWSGEYIIVASEDAKAANGTITSNQFGATSVTINADDTISNPADSIVWIFESYNDGYSVKNKATGTYAAIGTSSTSASMSSTASAFTISEVTSSDTWRVAASSGRYFSYYASNDAFRTYAPNSAATRLYGKTGKFLTEAGAPYFAVTYHENTNDTVTNMPSNTSVRQGTSYTIPNTVPVCDGYRFDGWATSSSGTVAYAAGSLPATISNVTAAIDLYAKWSVVPQATVTFYAADNTTTFDTQTVYEGVAPTVPSSEPTKAPSGIHYYTFAGWARTAGGSVESPFTVIASGESARAYYPIFTENTATFTLTLSGRTKVATEGSFNSTVLQPVLTANHEGCTATISSLSYTYTTGSASIATVATTGNVLTVTGVSAGTITLSVTATYDNGQTATTSVTVTVIAGSGTSAGYKLITKANVGSDVSSYDWTGDYIMVGREFGTSASINTWKVMKFDWTDDTTATLGDGSGGNNITGFTLDPADCDEFGAATATTGGVTLTALHTGEADYTSNPTTTGQGFVFDRIAGFKDSSDNDITGQYVLKFELVDEVNNYYIIRIKGTNYYLSNSNTTLSGGNSMGGQASPDSIADQLLWKISWASDSDIHNITASASGDTTAKPDILLIENVYALKNSTPVSRAIFYNQAGNGFRVYGSGAYTNNLNRNSTSGYNVFLYGKQNPFEAEVIYDGTPRNTTDAKITVPWNYATQAGNSSLLLEGNLDPESYPGWTILNSGIPTWTLIGAYNANGTTFNSSTSLTAVSGTENANFNVANWTASDVGKYYVVRVGYQVQDPDGVVHEVGKQAMIVVGSSDNTYTTVIYEAGTDKTGSIDVPARVESVDLNAYVVDNYSAKYYIGVENNGMTASEPANWTVSASQNYTTGTYSISSSGVLTWNSATVTNDVVEITATAGLSNGSTNATVSGGSIIVNIRELAYTAEVQATSGAAVTEIPFGSTAFGVTVANFQDKDLNAPSASTYSINDATEWHWTASTLAGASVPVTVNSSTGAATINVSGLAADTQIIVRATNVIATESGSHTVVTVTGKIFTVGADNSLHANDDSFVLDFDRNATLNVMANDRNATGATISAIGGTNASMASISGSNIIFTVPRGQLTTASYTFTYTLTKSGESDSTATVTVKPSSAIYYEDTNSFFTYTDGTQGKWTAVGTDSGWTQSATDSNDVSAIGYDESGASLTWSSGVYHKANVGNSTTYGTSGATGASSISSSFAKWPMMEFSFVGNAFSLSMMRNNNTGLIAVYVDGAKVKNVATSYGATGGAYDPNKDYGGFIYNSAESNYGMPTFYWAAEGGTAGSHTVKVVVLYSGAYDHASPKAGNYDVYIDGVTIYNPISGSTNYKYISFRDTVLATGSLGVPATTTHDYSATLSPAALSVGTGHTGTMQVSLTDEGETVYSGYTVAWTSSDSSVATVTASGSLNTSTGVNTATVTGVSAGTATITATITTPGGTTVVRTASVTVTDTVYTVTYILPSPAGTQQVTYTDESITLGSGVTHLTAAQLAAYNAHPYVFRGWAPATVSDTTTQPGGLLDNGMTLTIDGDRTYYAVYTYGTSNEDFMLRTDLNTPLVDGETIAIYETHGSSGDDRYMLSNADYSSTWNNWRLGVAATPENGFVKMSNTSLYWDVVATTGGFYLKDQDGKYLSATSTDGQLVMVTTPDEKAVWNATTTGVSGANSVYIYNNEASPKYLQHFSGYAEFGAYTFDVSWADRNEMQIFVQQPNNLTYTTDLQSNTATYTVNYNVNGSAYTSEQITEGNDPSFPSVTGAYTELAGYSHDYTFLGWIPATIAEDTTTAPATIYTSGDSYTLTGATTFYAVFTYTGAGSAAAGYSLSDSAPEAGDTVILAIKSGSDYYALPHGTTAAATWSGTAITLTNGAVADTTDLLWDVEDSNNSSYPVKFTYGSSKYFKLNSSQLAYTGDGATGYMKFTASGDGFTMENSTPRYLAQSSTSFGVTSNSADAATVYVFKYSTSGGSANYYATTLGAAAPITHSYAASISPASLALHPGETGTVTATLTDNGVTVSGATPTYTTSLASVATVAANGTVTAVANGNATITATYTVDGTDYTATCSVAVTTLATYNVTYYVNGSQYGQVESVTQGDSPSFTAPSYDVSSYNAHAYEFLGWKQGSALSADTTDAQTLYVAGNTNVISADTNFYAVYRYTEGGSVTTAVDQLSNGASADYVIAANVGGTYYAMSNTFASKIDGTSITTPGSSISSSDATGYAVTIEKSADGWTISNGTKLLGYPTSGTDFTNDTHPYWSITTGSHGSYRVTNTNTTTRAITYRTGTVNKFAPYATNNINGTEYYDVEIIPVGGGSATTYYATTLNVAAAHSYVASISPTSVTVEEGQETTAIGTLTDNGITTTDYTPTYTSSNTSVATVSSIGYVEAISAGSATITVSYSVDGTTYSATCAVTVTAAPVVTTYTVSYYVNGSLYETETIAANGHPDFDVPTVNVSGYDAHSYSFIGWAASTVSETTTSPTMYTASNASSYTVTGNVSFHAVYTWSEGGSGGSSTYTLVTATSQLTSGADIVIAASGYDYAMSTTQNSNNRGQASITKSDSTITLGSDVCEFTLGAGTTSGTWSFYDDNSSGYIYAASSSKNYLRTESTLSANSSWTISVTSAGVATVTAQGTNTHNLLQYNNGSSIFSAYSSAQKDIALYVKSTSSGSGSTNYYTTTLEAGDGTTATLSVSPSSMSLSTGGYGQIAVTAANGGAGAYVTAASSNTSVATVYALNDGNNSFGVSAGGTGSATITIRYFDSSANQLTSETVSVSVTAASGTGGTNADYGRVGSDGNAPTTSGSTNAGTRGVVCTSISQKAADYYAAKGVTWADLTALSGVYTNSSVTAASGNALKSQLDSLMNLTNTVTYSSLTTYWPNTDKSNGSSQNLYIYSNVTSNSSVSREHVWPKSRGQFYESGAGSDLQHLRPEESTVNSTRGNHTMGYVNGVLNNPSTKTYGGNTVLWYNGSYSSNDCSGLVEVMDCCKGDVARILLYVYTAYPENTNLFTKTSGGGSGNNASDGNKVIESLNTLLEWCALDPVDTWEMSRNDAVQTIQGNRNVYIDYPELAWMIFNLTPPTTMQTPSGQAAAGNVGTRNSANYYTSAVNNTAIMSEDPAPETRGGATRAIGDENTSLPVTGAVMINGIGQISNNDDVMAYLASYGAQNCLVVPANGSVVFYLTGGSAEAKIAIGASALNGTGTTLKVYQISAVSGSSATGTVLLEQTLASSTEMYFAINGIAWTGTKSNVLMVRNEGSAPMVLTNLRAVSGTVEGHISTGGTDSNAVGGEAATRGVTRDTENELQMVIDSNAILAGLAGVQSINEGTFGDETPVTPVDPVDPVESDIVLLGNTISLNGQIDVNFYLDIPDELFDDGVYATIDGVRVDFTEGTYGTMVSKKLPAKEMNTKVTLKLYAADGTPLTFKNGSATVTENRYSVQDYLTYVIGHPETYAADLVKLCKAMSDYGSYTQQTLGFDVENAKAIYLADEIANVTCDGYAYSYTANTEHISFLGASVVTESETAIRVYFTLNGEGFTATVDGEPAAIQTNERGTFVEIANISAKNLGDPHTIAVTNGSETVTISNCSAYSYVQSVLSYAGASDSLKLAVKALKLYGDLAAEYFNK
ncbi:MAG: endonuclease [Oscillospiraceae bacterium]|nr:endonuclease [Oscillospiraceae bacterium]